MTTSWFTLCMFLVWLLAAVTYYLDTKLHWQKDARIRDLRGLIAALENEIELKDELLDRYRGDPLTREPEPIQNDAYG